MRLRFACLVFPLLIVALMICERGATFLLGLDPAAPQLWAMSLELRAIFRPSLQWMSLLTGDSLVAELLLLGGIAAALLAMLRTRNWPVMSFLANNGALAFIAIMVFVSSRGVIASADGWDFAIADVLAVRPDLNLLQLSVVGIGLIGCIASHIALLTRHDASRRAIRDELRSLARLAGTPRA